MNIDYEASVRRLNEKVDLIKKIVVLDEKQSWSILAQMSVEELKEVFNRVKQQ